MGRKLKFSVVMGAKTYEGGSEPPADVAKQITNPDAWEDEPEKASSSRSGKSDSK